MPHGKDLTDIVDFCKCLASSPFYARLGVGGVLSIFLTAKELNMPFMCALNGGLHNIEGKVTMAAQTMGMLIISSGNYADIIEHDETKCKIRFTRCDRKNKSDEYTYTIEDAKTAGYFGGINAKTGQSQKVKDNWIKHPKDMLYARCLSGGARKFMPDIIMNAYVFGEIPGDDDITVEPIEEVKEKFEEAKIEVSTLEIESKIDEKYLGFDEFCVQYNITEGTLEDEFLQQVAISSNISLTKAINFAMSNPENFQNCFSKWEKEKRESAV
jgi:hypothetical protein